jgi:hypothetical protein
LKNPGVKPQIWQNVEVQQDKIACELDIGLKNLRLNLKYINTTSTPRVVEVQKYY